MRCTPGQRTDRRARRCPRLAPSGVRRCVRRAAVRLVDARALRPDPGRHEARPVGIHSAGTVTLRRSSVDVNEALAAAPISGDSNGLTRAHGGGLYNDGGVVDLRDSSVSKNKAVGTAGGFVTRAEPRRRPRTRITAAHLGPCRERVRGIEPPLRAWEPQAGGPSAPPLIPEHRSDLRFCRFAVSAPDPPARSISCRMGSVWDQGQSIPIDFAALLALM
jgi:hypothetical protein